MDNCKGKVEEISLLCDGELEAQQGTELRAHIDQCQACKIIYNAFSSISDSLGGELVEPPEMLAKGIMFKINNREKCGRSRRFAFGRFTAIAACLAIILLGAGRFGLFDSLNAGSAAPAAAPNEAAVQKDEAVLENDIALAESSMEIPKNYLTGFGDGFMSPDSPASDGGTMHQFGGNTSNFSVFGGMPETRMADAAKMEIAILVMDSAEISVYKGEYLDDNDKVISANHLLSISNKESLDALASLLVFTESNTEMPQEASVEDLKPAFTLLIPKDNSSSDRMEDITVSIWFDDKKVICRDSKSDALHFAEGTMENFLKFIESEKQAQRIM